MTIRRMLIGSKDEEQISQLLAKYNFALSGAEIQSGRWFVAEEGEQIIGCIWCMVQDKMACVDYLCVDEDFRDKVSTVNRSKVGLELAVAVFTYLADKGVHKFFAVIGERKESESMFRFYRDTLGMTERKVSRIVNGYPRGILDNLKKRCLC